MKNNFQLIRKNAFTYVSICLIALSMLVSCNSSNDSTQEKTTDGQKKIGVLLVNHGSRSSIWRKALMDFEKSVKGRVLADGIIKGTKTAHMEYTEPSIATRLKEFDKEGYTDIIVIPIFLTVSPHTFEDIPTIIGQKVDPAAKEALKIEKIECYTPKARTYITPNLDFTDILKKNVLRRVKSLSKDASKEGIVLIGYGDETYDKEWGQLFDKVGEYVKENTGIDKHSYGWCGHIVHYDPTKTTYAINEVLKTKEKAIVIPVLVAFDEEFQNNIIGTGISKVENHKERVTYIPDALLPDANVEQWVIDVSKEFVQKINQ